MKAAVLALVLFLLTPALASAGKGQWWYRHAQLLYQEGEADRALALLKAIPKRFPADHDLVLKSQVLAAHILAERHDYDAVLKVLKPLVNRGLTAEGLLLLAQACEKKGLYDEVMLYTKLLRKRYPTLLKCEVSLLEARIYEKRHLPRKAKALAEEVLRGECQLSLKAEALALLLRCGGGIAPYLSFIKEHPSLRRHRPEIIKDLALYHLKQGALKLAEKEIYEYLNYSGNEKEAPGLLFQLAEAYFARQRYREARRLYELVFTSWPAFKEATFAKFRLYHMRYLFEEKIGHKTAYTRRLLLAICRRLKRDFPKAPITEEAHVLEIRLLLEDHRPEEALASIWDFLKRYPTSPYLKEVYGYLCQASSPVDQKYLAARDFLGLIAFHQANKAAFEAASCGLHYYWLSQAYHQLNLTGAALLALLRAREFGVPKAWEPDLLLNLADLFLERREAGDVKLAGEVLSVAAKKFPEISSSPYYLFLRGEQAFLRRDFAAALNPLRQAMNRTADQKLREQAHRLYLEALLDSGRLAEAFKLLQGQKDLEPFWLKRVVLSALSYGRLSLADKASRSLLKVAPQDDEALWLRALVLERFGEEKKAQEIWASLSQKGRPSSPFVRLASELVRASSLIDQARREIY